MSWKLVGNPKTQRITRNLAMQFANMEPAPDDRPISEQRLRVYEKVARSGDFRPVEWATAFCVETGGTYRVNGKHTSTVFSRLDPIPELYAVISTYSCDDLRDVSRLYSTFDSKMQSRTVSDINRSFASCVPQLVETPLRYINLTASAVWYARLQEKYKEMQPAERAEALLDHWDFTVWATKLLGRGYGTYGHLVRMPIFAAMFLTRQKHPSKAEEFWTEVKDETGAKPDDPTRKLSRFLLTHAMFVRDKPRRERYIVTERQFFVKSLHAWNAWMTNEPTNLNYVAKAPIPVVK